jgi:hypothetical protein
VGKTLLSTLRKKNQLTYKTLNLFDFLPSPKMGLMILEELGYVIVIKLTMQMVMILLVPPSYQQCWRRTAHARPSSI